jgi:hypothetical protein
MLLALGLVAPLSSAGFNVSGLWCDQSNRCDIDVTQTADAVDVAIGSAAHIASGSVFPSNRSINLTFSAGNIHSYGIFPSTTPTDFTNITWRDPADLKAHNSWCKAGSAGCAAAPPPPAPPTPGPPPSPYPYPVLYGGSFSEPAVPDSPDPLIQYRWADNFTNTGTLQVFTQQPTAVLSATAGAFANAESLLQPAASVAVTGEGSIAVDFGSEAAAWLDFDSPDLLLATGAMAAEVSMSISEYNVPGTVQFTTNSAASSDSVALRVALRRILQHRCEDGGCHAPRAGERH